MASYKASEQFQRGFEAAFHGTLLNKYANSKNEHWGNLLFDLEMLSEALAGPMYNVLTKGNHHYVYRDSEGRFPNVTDAASFRNWALSLGHQYQTIVAQLQPETVEEEDDKHWLTIKANAMVEIVALAEDEIATNR